MGGSPEDPPLELDRPQTNEGDAADAKTTFTGDGGPNVGNWFNKLAYSINFQSTDMLLSDAVRPESQILYDRSIQLEPSPGTAGASEKFKQFFKR